MKVTPVRPVTLLDYLASFKKSSASLIGVGVIPALITVKSDWNVYAFPALGDLDAIARAGAVALTLIVICSGYLMVGNRHIRLHIMTASFVTFISLVLYLAGSHLYVRRIPVPSRNSVVVVSVGSRRSEFANHNFSSDSDISMMRDRGFDEESIEELWTPNSILVARLWLYLSYLGMVLGWTYCFSGYMALDVTQMRSHTANMTDKSVGASQQSVEHSVPDDLEV